MLNETRQKHGTVRRIRKYKGTVDNEEAKICYKNVVNPTPIQELKFCLTLKDFISNLKIKSP